MENTINISKLSNDVRESKYPMIEMQEAFNLVIQNSINKFESLFEHIVYLNINNH